MATLPGQTETIENRLAQIREARYRKLERSRRADERVYHEGRQLLRAWTEHEEARQQQQQRRAAVESRRLHEARAHLDADVEYDIARFSAEGRQKRARIRKREEDEDRILAARTELASDQTEPATSNQTERAMSDQTSGTTSKADEHVIDWVYLNGAGSEQRTGIVADMVASLVGNPDETVVDYIVELCQESPAAGRMVEALEAVFAEETEAFVAELWRRLGSINNRR